VYLPMHAASSESGANLDELDAVAPRIFREEAVRAGQRIIFGDLYGVCNQRRAEPGEIADGESGLSLFCWAKIGFYSDMDLLIAALEPAAAASAKRGGLFNFSQA
jgi:hypothetical protein